VILGQGNVSIEVRLFLYVCHTSVKRIIDVIWTPYKLPRRNSILEWIKICLYAWCSSPQEIVKLKWHPHFNSVHFDIILKFISHQVSILGPLIRIKTVKFDEPKQNMLNKHVSNRRPNERKANSNRLESSEGEYPMVISCYRSYRLSLSPEKFHVIRQRLSHLRVRYISERNHIQPDIISKHWITTPDLPQI